MLHAITVCQPFASLIALPDSDPRAKRVENRPKPWSHRGEIAIHAGKSKAWLGRVDDFGEPGRIDVAALPFGAIVALADVIDCVPFLPPKVSAHEDLDGSVIYRVEDVGGFRPDVLAKYPWLATHIHVSGPWCLLLARVKPLREPVACKGQLGLWGVPEALEALVRSSVLAG